MPTIPFEAAVDIIPGVISAAGAAVSLSLVTLSQSVYAPQNEVLGFPSSADVGAYFGETSPEYTIAQTYFTGPENALASPGMIYFLGYAEAAVPGWLLGASGVPATQAALDALTGTLIITVAGTLYTSSNINLSGLSFTAAAAAMQAAFTSPPFTITYDSLHQAFFINTTGTGATSTITYCTGTLAAGVGLNAASGGTLSQGAAAAVPATQMNWLVANFQNWASFMTTWASTLTERQAFANWCNSVAPRYGYWSWDTDTIDDVLNNPSSFGAWLEANSIIGTLPQYGTAQHAAAGAGWAASWNLNQKNGRSTLCFRQFAGLPPSVQDEVTYANVTSNNYNVYGAFGSNNPANNADWMTPGLVSGDWDWADTYFGQIVLNSNLQVGIVDGLRSVGQVPYNSDGDALMAGFCKPAIQAALNFGTIRVGVNLSASQIAQVIDLVGSDVSPTIIAQGYYLYTDAAGTAANVRAARGSPPAILLYQDGESIQSVTLPSLVIQ
jgi:hypothetical protein